MACNVRQSNIELLRILAIMGIIILHYNNREMGGMALLYTEHLAANHIILIILESVAVCAVDLFIMVSGYFLAERNDRNLLKVINLVIQVIVFNEVSYLASGIFGHGSISIKGIVSCLIPNNYFVVLYCVLYVLSPLVNFSLERIKQRYHFKTIAILVLFFSIFPTIVDVMNIVSHGNWNGLSTIGMYGSQWGYTIVNFILMYIIGAYIRKIDLSQVRCYVLALIQCVLIVVISLISYINEDIAWSYCSPIVVLEAVIYLALFLKINIGSTAIINKLSKSCFTCFLTHTYFFRFIGVEKFSVMSPIVLLIHIICSCIGIFIICYFIYALYDRTTSFIWKKIDIDKFVLRYEDSK